MGTRQRDSYLSVWLKQPGRDAIDERARQAGVTRSDMVREMLAYAQKHMPKETK